MKNWIRNQVRNDWLNDCLVIYTEKGFFIDIKNEKIIQSFHNMNNSRGQLLMLPIFIYSGPTIQKSGIRRCFYPVVANNHVLIQLLALSNQENN